MFIASDLQKLFCHLSTQELKVVILFAFPQRKSSNHLFYNYSFVFWITIQSVLELIFLDHYSFDRNRHSNRSSAILKRAKFCYYIPLIRPFFSMQESERGANANRSYYLTPTDIYTTQRSNRDYSSNTSIILSPHQKATQL